MCEIKVLKCYSFVDISLESIVIINILVLDIMKIHAFVEPKYKTYNYVKFRMIGTKVYPNLELISIFAEMID